MLYLFFPHGLLFALSVSNVTLDVRSYVRPGKDCCWNVNFSLVVIRFESQLYIFFGTYVFNTGRRFLLFHIQNDPFI